MIPGHFTGGWLGIDMFLTLSGFFIAAMLLQEHRSTGTIHYWNFIKRRGRRLLPAHLLLLAATVVLTWWLMPVGRRPSVAGDIAASVFEVVNWRFISADQSYFNNISMPSPLRHMWSLSVQEQYYVIFPLVLIAVGRYVKSRNGKMAFFAGLTLLSMWRMYSLYEPGTDPSRVYYGTDTRIFEVLIGVLAAFLLSERAFAASRGRRHYGWLARWDRALGWAGLGALALLFYWMNTLSEYSPWLFQGGLALVCGLTLVAIVAASSPNTNLLQRMLSWAPLRWIGRMGFPLYIWHWPAVVYTALLLPNTPQLWRNCISMTFTVAVAVVSNKYLEDPIHRRGLRALFPGRPTLRKFVALGAAPAILFGSILLAVNADAGSASGRDLRLAIAPYHPTAGEKRVVLLGNSVAAGIAERRNPASAPDLHLDLIASLGCDPFIRDVVQSGQVLPPTKDCLAWRQDWPSQIDRGARPVVAYLLSPNLLPDYKVNGKVVAPGSAEHDAVIIGVLDELRRRAYDAGAGAFMVFNLACHQRADFGGNLVVSRSNSMSKVKHLNTVLSWWAKQHGVPVGDTFGTLCPNDTYYNAVDGVPLYDDTIHYSVKSAPIIYDWMAPELQKVAQQRGTDNDGLADLRK